VYSLDFSVVLDRFPELLWGCLGTLALALAGTVLALAIGLSGVLLRRSRITAACVAVKVFVEIIRNVTAHLPLLGCPNLVHFEAYRRACERSAWILDAKSARSRIPEGGR